MAGRFPRIELEGPGSVKLSLEERYETLENIFVHQFFELYRILGQRLGWDEANDIARHVTDSSVPIIVDAYKRKFDLEGDGAQLLCQVLQAEFQAEGSDVAVVEETAEQAEFDVHCVFGNMLQSGKYADVKIEEGLCQAGCEEWMCMVGERMEPDIVAERVTWMGDGAPRCKYRLRQAAKD